MKKNISLLIIILGLTFGATSFVHGFGVTPPFINSQILTRGSHFESTVYLSRGSPEADTMAEVTIDAPEIASWITIKQGMNFILPKGEKLVPLTVIIDVPKDAAFKRYLGYVRVRALPIGGAQSGQVATVGGTRIDLGLTVTETGFPDFKVQGVNVPTFEQGDPFVFLMVLNNTGNVRIRPSKIHVDISDLNMVKTITSGDITEMDFVEPFQTGQIKGSFPVDLAVGEYWANITVYNEAGPIGEVFKIFFKVVPPGTLKQNESEKKGLSASDYKLGLITILMVVLILTWINRDKIKRVFRKK
jgi:hypothetical protein